MTNKLKDILLTFDSISLDEMDAVSLMKRTDTKFVFSRDTLPFVLSGLSDNYSLLYVNSAYSNKYNTLYYDTPDLKFFSEHQNGKLNRYKVRSRKYVESDTCFLEIKFKNNKGKTIKTRVKKDRIEEVLSPSALDFITQKAPSIGKNLQAEQWNSFSRLTLVGKNILERVTIDLGLEFKNKKGTVMANNIVVAEIKQEKYNVASPFIQALRHNKIQPMRFSKYCIGTVLLHESQDDANSLELKTNRFKSKIRTVKKIQNGII